MKRTLNIRVRPRERTSLSELALQYTKGNMSALMAALLFGTSPVACELKRKLHEMLVADATTKHFANRVPHNFVLSADEIAELHAKRQRGETASETVRRLIGLRPIPFNVQAAARMLSRRGNAPTLTQEAVAAYWRLLELRSQMNEMTGPGKGGRL